MPEWFWIVLGFGVAYGSVGAYALALHRRLTRLRRRSGSLE